jgi:peroxiredoxin
MKIPLLVAILLAAPIAGAEEATAPVLQVGSTAPEFTLPVYNPAAAGLPTASLGSLVGDEADSHDVKVVLVSFMASWCKPCKKELPFLQKLAGQYHDRGLRVLVVSIDKEEKGQEEVRALIDQLKITVPVLKDRFNFVARRWLGEKSPLPSVFLVDAHGKIAMASSGYAKDASTFLTGEVEKVLASAPAPAEGGK